MHPSRALTVALAALVLAVPGVAVAGWSPSPDVLVFRTASGQVRVMGGQTGGVPTLPSGVLSRNGATLLTARVRGGRTTVQRLETRSGSVLAERTIIGAWGFQRAAEDGTLVAGGEDLAPVALVAAARVKGYHGSAKTTRFALLRHDLQGKVRLLTLPGNLGVDALSSDGTRLYVIQHDAGERYAVRGYDLVTRTLSGVIVDKREPNEKMQGLPLARTSSADGSWELTLYRRPSGLPFVHALMTTGLAAFCIDLPRAARTDPDATSSWGVAMRGSTMYLANAQTGWIGVIDVPTFKLVRSGSLGAQASVTAPARPLVASVDGSTLYLARPGGLEAVDPVTLTTRAPLAQGAFGSLALGPGGALLYATGKGSTLELDTTTGRTRVLPTGRGLTLVGVTRS